MINNLIDNTWLKINTAIRNIPTHIFYIIAGVFIVNIFAHSYLLITYDNHVFPNVYILTYPSYITLMEGRLISDLTYFLQGQAGIPSLQIPIAILIQIINGLLFARIFNYSDKFSIIVSTFILSLHPLIIDYHGFNGTSLTFVSGNFFAILAMLIGAKHTITIKQIITTFVLITITIASYQPNIVIIATVFLLIIFNHLTTWDGTLSTAKASTKRISILGLTIIVAAIFYLLIIKYMQLRGIIYSELQRAHLNNVQEIVAVIPLVLADIKTRLFAEQALFGQSLGFLPGLFLILYIIAALYRIATIHIAKRYQAIAILLFVSLCVLLPVALYAAFILNNKAYWNNGRFYISFVYLLVFLILSCWHLLPWRPVKLILSILVVLVIYHVTIITFRTNHIGYMRTIQEFNFVNRITQRIEQLPGFSYSQQYSIVVIGLIPTDSRLYARTMTSPAVNAIATAFPSYRQAEMLNFLMGKVIFKYPSTSQVEAAKLYAATHAVWPHKDSVALLPNNTVVVLLQKSVDDVITMMSGNDSKLEKKEMPIVGLPKGYTENNSINCQGSIGNLNGIQGYKKIHESGLLLIKEDFSINGWLVTSSKSGVVSPDDVFITLKNFNDPILYSRASRYQREDIKTAFKKTDLNDAGYNKTIYISSLSGKYTLGIAIGHEGKLSQCSQFNIPISVE